MEPSFRANGVAVDLVTVSEKMPGDARRMPNRRLRPFVLPWRMPYYCEQVLAATAGEGCPRREDGR